MLFSTSDILQTLLDELRIALFDPNITFNAISNLYGSFYSFFLASPKLESEQIRILVHCCIEFINCIHHYIDTENVNEAEKLKQVVAVIQDISQLEGVKNTYVQLITVPILEKVTEPGIKLWFSKEILMQFNLIIQGTQKHARQMIVEQNRLFLYKLADLICTCGDYEYQAILLESIFRLCTSTQINRFADEIFPASLSFQDGLRSVNKINFDTGCRTFLNMINFQIKEVLSIKCEAVILGKRSLPAPQVEEEKLPFWVDFNSGSKTITFFTDKGRNSLELITINVTNISNVSTFRLLVSDSPFSVGCVIVFQIRGVGTFKCPSSVKISKAYKLKLSIYNCPELNELVTNLLPRWFGNKFKHRAILDKDCYEVQRKNRKLRVEMSSKGRVYKPLQCDCCSSSSNDFKRNPLASYSLNSKDLSQEEVPRNVLRAKPTIKEDKEFHPIQDTPMQPRCASFLSAQSSTSDAQSFKTCISKHHTGSFEQNKKRILNAPPLHNLEQLNKTATDPELVVATDEIEDAVDTIHKTSIMSSPLHIINQSEVNIKDETEPSLGSEENIKELKVVLIRIPETSLEKFVKNPKRTRKQMTPKCKRKPIKAKRVQKSKTTSSLHYETRYQKTKLANDTKTVKRTVSEEFFQALNLCRIKRKIDNIDINSNTLDFEPIQHKDIKEDDLESSKISKETENISTSQEFCTASETSSAEHVEKPKRAKGRPKIDINSNNSDFEPIQNKDIEDDDLESSKISKETENISSSQEFCTTSETSSAEHVEESKRARGRPKIDINSNNLDIEDDDLECSKTSKETENISTSQEFCTASETSSAEHVKKPKRAKGRPKIDINSNNSDFEPIQNKDIEDDDLESSKTSKEIENISTSQEFCTASETSSAKHVEKPKRARGRPKKDIKSNNLDFEPIQQKDIKDDVLKSSKTSKESESISSLEEFSTTSETASSEHVEKPKRARGRPKNIDIKSKDLAVEPFQHKDSFDINGNRFSSSKTAKTNEGTSFQQEYCATSKGTHITDISSKSEEITKMAETNIPEPAISDGRKTIVCLADLSEYQTKLPPTSIVEKVDNIPVTNEHHLESPQAASTNQNVESTTPVEKIVVETNVNKLLENFCVKFEQQIQQLKDEITGVKEILLDLQKNVNKC